MINELEAFYINKEEPVRGCLLALRSYILSFHKEISESWTHRMPMFRYGGKLFCYLWVDRKTHLPYIGIYKGIDIDHPKLDLGKRNKMKILTLNPEDDIPVNDLNEIFELARALY
jgi:hypothetical protein